MTEYSIRPWAEAAATWSTEWLALGRELQLNPTLLPEWTGVIVETLTEPASVQVLVASEGGRLDGIVPFRVRTDAVGPFRVRILEPVSSILAYHAQLPARGDPTALLRHLAGTHRELGWDVLRMGGVLTDSPTEQAIRAVAQSDGLPLVSFPGEESPYLALGLSGEQLVARRRKRDRYLMRKNAKDFAAEPGAVELWYGMGGEREVDTDGLLEGMLRIERDSWKAPAGVAISNDPRETAYYRRLLAQLAAAGNLRACLMVIDEVPAAYCLCYAWNGTFGCMKSTYREALARLAVGHCAQNQLLIRLADEGGTEFDFLGDSDRYKLAWSPTTRRHANHFLYAPAGRGWWLGTLQRLRNRFRPAGTPAQAEDEVSR